MRVFLFTVVTAVASATLPVRAQDRLPWYNVPVQQGPAGAYTCVTRPTGDMRLAVIVCDTYKMSMMPPEAQAFLMAHEHGHVFQFVNGLNFAPNPEADADCYAAIYLAQNNPQVLEAAIAWFERVLGPRGGDVTHGNGLQIAQLARQCAARVSAV